MQQTAALLDGKAAVLATVTGGDAEKKATLSDLEASRILSGGSAAKTKAATKSEDATLKRHQAEGRVDQKDLAVEIGQRVAKANGAETAFNSEEEKRLLAKEGLKRGDNRTATIGLLEAQKSGVITKELVGDVKHDASDAKQNAVTSKTSGNILLGSADDELASLGTKLSGKRNAETPVSAHAPSIS